MALDQAFWRQTNPGPIYIPSLRFGCRKRNKNKPSSFLRGCLGLASNSFPLPLPSEWYLPFVPVQCPKKGVVWELLGAGANCSPMSDKHWTPLLAAAVGGYSEVARQLIGAGASVTERTSNGWNALHMASQAGHVGGCFYFIFLLKV